MIRGESTLGRSRSSESVKDRDLLGAFVYGAALAGTAVLAFAFNALMGRRLSAGDFGSFGALLAVLLALSGPSSALFGGAAMSVARSGLVPRARWLRGVAVVGGAAAVAALLPLPMLTRSALWIVTASATWVVISWNRGLLIGLGRLSLVGGTMVFEGLARLVLALVLISRGWRVGGAAAGLALGMASAALLTWVLLPRNRDGEPPSIAPEVWLSITGLLFLGIVQFPDVIAVRLTNPRSAGSYNAASSLARMVAFAQVPAAVYAIRRAAVAGPAQALKRALPLALIPGLLALAALEAFPRQALHLTYGARYDEMVGLVRLLAVAMLFSGVVLVLVNAAMGAGRTSWVLWTCSIGVPGIAAIFAVNGQPSPTAVAVTVVQALLLVAGATSTHRLIAAGRGAGGAILFLNWRDTSHPEGGGSEVFVEEVARRLALDGRRVTVFCADHGLAPREEVRDRVRYLRRGSWWSVYVWAALYHLRGKFGPYDVIVDVQNAVPFFSPLYCSRPVVVLVHHVHREQWGMLFGPRMARAGWWVESRLSPLLYRNATYVAVSIATKMDLVNLGVDPQRMVVVRNGGLECDQVSVPKAVEPTIAYLGRLVPHKRVEILFEAAAALRKRFPRVRVRVIGRGGWEERLRACCRDLGVQDLVSFEGYVSNSAKLRLLAEAWVLAMPSVKEGWGLAVMEAAAVGTPAVAFRVGGLQESVVDGQTGLLADTPEEFAAALATLLGSRGLRERMGAAARLRSSAFDWNETASDLASTLDSAVQGRLQAPEERRRLAGRLILERGSI